MISFSFATPLLVKCMPPNASVLSRNHFHFFGGFRFTSTLLLTTRQQQKQTLQQETSKEPPMFTCELIVTILCTSQRTRSVPATDSRAAWHRSLWFQIFEKECHQIHLTHSPIWSYRTSSAILKNTYRGCGPWKCVSESRRMQRRPAIKLTVLLVIYAHNCWHSPDHGNSSSNNNKNHRWLGLFPLVGCFVDRRL